ncbi:LBF_2804 family protein [Larkinella arboricola]|uniref:Uncharacterized protein n=1 Tax=Larkinella arboricola TaxID=643671 RepID=A0A327X854_LARAB|nr:hypothetical protein [Larkinella arboricola]RAK02911.1 hypothetical protein LX87_01033 [Larkinella arboricola]
MSYKRSKLFTFMSDSPDSTGDFDQATAGRTALRYLARAMHTVHPSDEPFVLSRAEKLAIQRLKIFTMLAAAAVVVLGIWVFYLPHVLWTDWFTKTHTTLGDWPLISILFAVLILYLVVHALILVHNGAIRLIEVTCQFPRFHDASYNRHLNQLAENGPQRSVFRLRMQPRPLLPWTMPGYLVTVLLLAFASDAIVQLGFRFWNGQPISPVSMVLSSTLVAAVWIGWATHQILQQAQIRVMVPLTIRQFTNDLVEEFGREPAFRRFLPGILQQAGVSSKPGNYPHLLLLEALMSRFAIDPDKMRVVRTDGFAEQLASCPNHIRQGVERLFLFTILIDGHLSPLERNRLRQWQNAGVVKTPMADVETMQRNFVKGEGLWV